MLNVAPAPTVLPSVADDERELSLVGYLSSPSGLGAGARRNVVALTRSGFSVLKYNLALGHRFEMPVEGASVGLPTSSRTIFHLNPPEMLINSTAMRRVKKQSYVIGYWAWELPVMPAVWAGALDLVDEIWTPSRFVANAYGEATPKPISVIPHPIPLNYIPQTKGRERFRIPLDRYVFLAAFDTESYPTRKNPWGAVRAFMEAFPDRGSGSPLMVLKLHGTSHRSADLARLLAEISGHPLFQIIDESLTDDDILHLQSACDCFVSLHRSEGFGLNIAECMAAGRLAIATDFSGNRDFMHPANSILIPYGMREVARGDYVAGVGQWWAEPDHAASVRAMRWAFEHQDEARALGARAQDDIAAGFSFEHVGALAAAALARPFTKRALPSIPLLSHGSVAPRIGRNDPCPCGSGRKFKLCHGRTTNEKKR